ncbi:glycoside hydrolase [Violaceomyces palustris]|uniref:Glycoside hydrolase n=1 Tax=Violaceomyces palustris TaxID=1673888 RepID=A0ACD0NTE0_9BASI|nr:glycoside hydrolase [Violaceomyces palustris]
MSPGSSNLKNYLSTGLVWMMTLISVGWVEAHQRGIPWGCDDRWGENLIGDSMTWYHHWADGNIPQLDKKGMEYVPTCWGPSKFDKWNQRKSEMNRKLPEHLLSFNEPDVQGQATMGPKDAARLWMKEMQPWARKGVKVSTPQLCFDMGWLNQFMSECRKLGCEISFIALHWYGSYQDMDRLKRWVQKVHSTYPGYPIWLTEYGITSSSHPSQWQVTQFHKEAAAWLEGTGYVERAAWLGGFSVDDPPDAYPSALNAYFDASGHLREIGKWAATSSIPGKRKNPSPSTHQQQATSRGGQRGDGERHSSKKKPYKAKHRHHRHSHGRS